MGGMGREGEDPMGGGGPNNKGGPGPGQRDNIVNWQRFKPEPELWAGSVTGGRDALGVVDIVGEAMAKRRKQEEARVKHNLW